MKIFKNIYKSALLFAAMALVTSCGTDWLDEQPADGIDAGTALTTAASVESARTGMYKAFKGNSSFTDYYGREMLMYGDVRAEDIQYNFTYGSNRAQMYYELTFNSPNEVGQSTGIWQSPYITISRANHIVDGATAVSDYNDNKAMVDQYVAEAKVVRAYALFDLTRIYGKPYTMDNGASLGVPIVSSTSEYDAKPARSTVAECYTQVIKDLTEAISSGALAEDQTPGYINKWAAEALLARVYITKGDNANALATAEDIINNSPYQLWKPSEYATAWNSANAAHLNEMMFEFVITNSTDWNDREGIAYLYSEDSGNNPGYGDLIVSKDFYEMVSADQSDVRNDILLAPQGDPKNIFGDAHPYLNKFQSPNGDARYANIPMLRLSEVYLTAAEAAFELNQKDKAAKYLNAIIDNRYTEAAAEEVTASNITADKIYKERRKELVGEGQRYFDALRRGETITRYTNVSNRGWHEVLANGANSYDRTWYKAYPPIPAYECDANQNIVQNDGYSKNE